MRVIGVGDEAIEMEEAGCAKMEEAGCAEMKEASCMEMEEIGCTKERIGGDWLNERGWEVEVEECWNWEERHSENENKCSTK